eukprot:CAMPEP_0118929832 /NCGR_PEP_ID=MMETSP1169-20130426/6718_1 /TAXON_ID=36882 /ORGANISM="Pyramimonas obovata, Strain CCMP722" /LENGTH=262 /DNA_ID=CAMNT_0006872091 /DNA_START=417 /DNA_END=1207 /DNA_ORIENTATION=+
MAYYSCANATTATGARKVEALSLQPLSSPASSITSSTDATRISRRPMIMTTTIEDETISGIRRSSTSVSSSTTRQLFAAANNGDDEKAVVDIVVHHEVDVLLAGGSSGPSTRHLNRKLLRELSIDTFVSPRGWNLLPAHGFYFPGYLARDFIYPYKIRKYLVRHLTFPFYTNNIKQLVENRAFSGWPKYSAPEACVSHTLYASGSPRNSHIISLIQCIAGRDEMCPHIAAVSTARVKQRNNAHRRTSSRSGFRAGYGGTGGG